MVVSDRYYRMADLGVKLDPDSFAWSVVILFSEMNWFSTYRIKEVYIKWNLPAFSWKKKPTTANGNICQLQISKRKLPLYSPSWVKGICIKTKSAASSLGGPSYAAYGDESIMSCRLEMNKWTDPWWHGWSQGQDVVGEKNELTFLWIKDMIGRANPLLLWS